MRPEALLLQQQRLETGLRNLAAEKERLEAGLAARPEIDALEAELGTEAAARDEVARRLGAAERDAQEHRHRLQARERELMSGHLHQPSELTRLSQEVEHMRSRLREEEDGELALMEESEAREGAVRALEERLGEARARLAAEAPRARAELDRISAEAELLEAERQEVWERIPADFQAAYRRVRAPAPVAEVTGGQCGGCRVGLTTNELQQVRRGGIVICQSCSRLLVAA
ncbi:MAG: zinc ribbon domain-containing protein [Candidatus Dormibacteraceae bacterium]